MNAPPDNDTRFVLSTVVANSLICFGINPSTAEPGDLDPIVNCVNTRAEANGYDSFIMLNVYSQWTTNPNRLHKVILQESQAENEQYIATLSRIKGGGRAAITSLPTAARTAGRDVFGKVHLFCKFCCGRWSKRY